MGDLDIDVIEKFSVRVFKVRERLSYSRDLVRLEVFEVCYGGVNVEFVEEVFR